MPRSPRSWPLGLLAGCLGVSGCFKATFDASEYPDESQERSQYKSFFLFGVVGQNDVDVRSHCPSGRAWRVRSGGNAGTTLLSIATVGIYTPRMVYFTCLPPGKR
jgi:hypothetical protein